MTENAKRRYMTMPAKERYLRLKLESTSDVREYIMRLLRNLKEKGPDAEIEYLGRVSQILSVWLKSYQLTDLEQRVTALEMKEDPV